MRRVERKSKAQASKHRKGDKRVSTVLHLADKSDYRERKVVVMNGNG